MNCIHCGAEAGDDARLCCSCGKPLPTTIKPAETLFHAEQPVRLDAVAAGSRQTLWDAMIEEFQPKIPRDEHTCRALVLADYKPYARKMVRGKRMEVISMPFVQDGTAFENGGCGIGIMVREPNDPATVVEWSIPISEVRAAIRAAKRGR